MMKSFFVIALPILLAALLAGLGYMYKTGMIEEMLAQTETASSLPEAESDRPKLSDVDTSTTAGLSQARDIVRASLKTQMQKELDRQHRESRETEKEKKLYKSMDDWLKRTD